jgi:hypothetical protein
LDGREEETNSSQCSVHFEALNHRNEATGKQKLQDAEILAITKIHSENISYHSILCIQQNWFKITLQSLE